MCVHQIGFWVSHNTNDMIKDADFINAREAIKGV